MLCSSLRLRAAGYACIPNRARPPLRAWLPPSAVSSLRTTPPLSVFRRPHPQHLCQHLDLPRRCFSADAKDEKTTTRHDKVVLTEDQLVTLRSLSLEQVNAFLATTNPEEALEKLAALEAQLEAQRQRGLQDEHDAEANPLSEEEAKKKNVPQPSPRQLKLYLLGNFLPFLGFGFFDNAIMLLCGDFIDANLGMTFGISTLAAAAMGNMVGDTVGIWLSGSIEYQVGRRVPDHRMTSAQARLFRVQTLKSICNVFGILLGCILGCFPLIWPENWRLYEPSAPDLSSFETHELREELLRQETFQEHDRFDLQRGGVWGESGDPNSNTYDFKRDPSLGESGRQ